MPRSRTLLVAAGSVAAIAVSGVGATYAIAGGDQGENATGPGADQARAAALVITKGGSANSVERDGGNGATWEVEVTRPDGPTVDVRLDDHFGLVVIEGDSEQK